MLQVDLAEQLYEFKDIGVYLSSKALVALQPAQEGKKEIAAKMVEHLVTHDLTMIQEKVDRVKE